MDACTLLPSQMNSQLNSKMYGYDLGKPKTISYNNNPNIINMNYLNTKTLHYNSSSIDERNSTTTTSSGSNSTTSSKIKLSASPTDSLVKNGHNSNCLIEAPVHPFGCFSSINKTLYSNNAHTDNTLQLDEDYENNAFQIMKLINEQKSCICPAKNTKQNNDFDLYDFSLFKSGGVIEIPKYCNFKI